MVMEMRYRGSCHCGATRFEASIDLEAGTGKCNCTRCWKTRWWAALIETSAFTLESGKSTMKNGERGGHCAVCGVTAFAVVSTEAWLDGRDMVSVNLACLDDLDPASLATAPVRFFDGRNDDWLHPPAETRHL
jgi:hypothetical protein